MARRPPQIYVSTTTVTSRKGFPGRAWEAPFPALSSSAACQGKGKKVITLRRSQDRGHTKIDWLESYHTFSFDQFYDPEFMRFRSLRVLNEDWVRPGAGFPTHPHRDMEIITVVLEGALEHKG